MAAAPADRRFAERFRIAAVAALATALNRLMHASYRTRLPDRSYAQRRREGEPVRCIYAAWHGMSWHVVHALRHQDVHMLVSTHRDGEIAARVGRRLGYRQVRGSSTRGGAEAMLELERVGREGGGDIIVTLDGPRGPARRAKGGALFLASRTGLPVVPMGLWVDRAWRIRSWDAHVIGKPLCRAALTLGPELHVPARVSRAELEEVWVPALERGMAVAEARARAIVEAS